MREDIFTCDECKKTEPKPLHWDRPRHWYEVVYEDLGPGLSCGLEKKAHFCSPYCVRDNFARQARH